MGIEQGAPSMEVKAEIIAIGDEILIGQIVDTNSSWLAIQLNKIGISVSRINCVGDVESEILDVLKQAESRVSCIILTGGLGPTTDDLTKGALVKHFETRLVRDEVSLAFIEEFFKDSGLPMIDSNMRQADRPENCIFLRNVNGTAPGMWFEREGQIVISLPGVPLEMKGIFIDEVAKRLRSKFEMPFIHHETIVFEGIGESFLSNRLSQWESLVKGRGMKVAYLPSMGRVRIRVSISGGQKPELLELVRDAMQSAADLVPEHFVGTEVYGI